MPDTLTLLSTLSALSLFLRQIASLWSLSENYGVHAKHWSFLLTFREEFLTLHCTCNDVADQRVLLGKISRKVHFFPKAKVRNSVISMREGFSQKAFLDLPFIFLLIGESREAEVRAD